MTKRIKTSDGRKHPDPLVLILSRGNMLVHLLGPPGWCRVPFRGEVN